MKQWFVIVLLALPGSFFAQKAKYDEEYLVGKEDSLKVLAPQIQMGRWTKDRLKADSQFIKTLVRALKSPYSFYYPFDSVTAVSIQYPEDSTFRIFTWHIPISENYYRQKGAIQMNTWDGSLKLFPLIDKSEIIKKPADTITDNNAWLGAIYYRIIQKSYFNKPVYTLLGFDANNVWSDKKIAEILTFSNDKPVFGGRYFSFEQDNKSRQGNNRFIIEYKKNAGARLNFDPDLDMLIVEHLIPENIKDSARKASYIGDGDYEGFSWKNGKWVHVEKIFDYKTPEGKPPVPIPLNPNLGVDEDKIEIKNEEIKSQPAKPVKKPTVKPNKKGQ